MATGKPKILWCWIEPPALAEFLPETEVEMNRPSTLFPPATEDELKALVPDADVLVVGRYFSITDQVIRAGKKLKAQNRLCRHLAEC